MQAVYYRLKDKKRKLFVSYDRGSSPRSSNYYSLDINDIRYWTSVDRVMKYLDIQVSRLLKHNYPKSIFNTLDDVNNIEIIKYEIIESKDQLNYDNEIQKIILKNKIKNTL